MIELYTHNTPNGPISGRQGDDILIGNAGNDTLDGGDGNDILIGELFSDVHVFGDSFSDNGNLFALTEGKQPDFPGFQGRFSNGPVWIENLIPKLGLEVNPENNVAFGGASTGYTNLLNTINPVTPKVIPIDSQPLPGLQTPIDNFLAKNNTVDPNALYVVFAGGVEYVGFGLTNPQEAIKNIETAITKLAEAGAKNFIVPNLFDLGATPFAKNSGSEEQQKLTKVTQEHNQALQFALNQLEQNSSINIINVDTDALFNDVTAKPDNFGFKNITDNFLSTEATNLQDTLLPNDFLFWNEIHPTTRFHDFLAQEALEEITSLPELLEITETLETTSDANNGNDLFQGGTGNDILIAGAGNDSLSGGSGNDNIYGLKGDDLLQGNEGSDILIGSLGNDTLAGGIGDDTLTGNSGSDRFVLSPGSGTDTITDFTSAQDLIELSDGLEFTDLTIAQGTSDLANDTLLSLKTSDELLAILTGVEASNITSTDFSIV